MYKPDIKLTKSGVPVLSKKEIDMIGEKHLINYTMVGQIADVFQVSLEAAGYRLEQLGYMT